MTIFIITSLLTHFSFIIYHLWYLLISTITVINIYHKEDLQRPRRLGLDKDGEGSHGELAQHVGRLPVHEGVAAVQKTIALLHLDLLLARQ